ncbi:MAG: hypothetical protein J6W02_01195 [Bacteroidaceae bacterium]|nr:hypothetical protein [Bacteroidaceae bacterium]
MSKILFSIKLDGEVKERRTWGVLNPVSRVVRSKKAYDRKREKRSWRNEE